MLPKVLELEKCIHTCWLAIWWRASNCWFDVRFLKFFLEEDPLEAPARDGVRKLDRRFSPRTDTKLPRTFKKLFKSGPPPSASCRTGKIYTLLTNAITCWQWYFNMVNTTRMLISTIPLFSTFRIWHSLLRVSSFSEISNIFIETGLMLCPSPREFFPASEPSSIWFTSRLDIFDVLCDFRAPTKYSIDR